MAPKSRRSTPEAASGDIAAAAPTSTRGTRQAAATPGLHGARLTAARGPPAVGGCRLAAFGR
ncbi:hypothetical protein A7U58_29810 [Burkholderia pseudomallei]|nr:hypothetical protein A7U58_29810 [Burkholderia pseudomallei]